MFASLHAMNCMSIGKTDSALVCSLRVFIGCPDAKKNATYCAPVKLKFPGCLASLNFKFNIVVIGTYRPA